MKNLAAIKNSFDKNGYVVVDDVLSPAQLDQLRAMVDKVLNGEIKPEIPEPGTTLPLDDFSIQWEDLSAGGEVKRRDKIRVAFHLCHSHPYFAAHATRPEIVEIAAALIGPRLRLYTDQMFVKPAHHGSEVPFHQDHSYWDALEPYNMVSCWLALDDATIENGCVRMIPGSHHKLLPAHRLEGPNAIGLLEEELDLTGETPVEIKAGSAMFHHSLTIHRSCPNTSDKGRRGFVTIYAPGDIQFVKPWDCRYGFREIVDNSLAPLP